MTRETTRFLLTLVAVTVIFMTALFLAAEWKNNQSLDVIGVTACELSITEDESVTVPEALRATTYVPPRNTYLPVMMFLVVKDTDKPVFTRCKNMTYRVVDTYSRRENDDLDREDRKLKTLARLIYSECIDVALLTHLEGI